MLKTFFSFFDTSTIGWDFFEIPIQVRSGFVVNFCSTFEHFFLSLRCAKYVLSLNILTMIRTTCKVPIMQTIYIASVDFLVDVSFN